VILGQGHRESKASCQSHVSRSYLCLFVVEFHGSVGVDNTDGQGHRGVGSVLQRADAAQTVAADLVNTGILQFSISERKPPRRTFNVLHVMSGK